MHAKDASVVAGIAIYRKIFIGSYILDIVTVPSFHNPPLRTHQHRNGHRIRDHKCNTAHLLCIMTTPGIPIDIRGLLSKRLVHRQEARLSLCILDGICPVDNTHRSIV